MEKIIEVESDSTVVDIIELYNLMFEYWKNLTEEYKVKSPQIIIVDSTAPPKLVKENVLITFDKSSDDGRRGLIDDIRVR